MISGWRNRMLVAGGVLASAIAIAAPVVSGGGGPSCGSTATTANFSTTFSAAAGGSTICLQAGDYGQQTNLQKSTQVTLTPAAGVAKSAVTIGLTGLSTFGVKLDGLTVAGIDFSSGDTGTYHDVAAVNSTFTKAAYFRNCRSSNTNILLDNDTFYDIVLDVNPVSGLATYNGRVSFPVGTQGSDCGATVSNSDFATTVDPPPGISGCADGIQVGADGVRIVNNTFRNIKQNYTGVDCGTAEVVSGKPVGLHVDSIQFVGSWNTYVAGNYFTDDENCLMAPDGLNTMTWIGNVCKIQSASTEPAMTLGSDVSSIITHNTFYRDGIRLFNKTGNAVPTGTTITDNVIPGGVNQESGTGITKDYNLATSAVGAHDIAGSPSYVGGALPSSRDGWQLTGPSAALTGADDGTPMGAQFPWPYTG